MIAEQTKEILQEFGKEMIEKSRDQTLRESYRIIDGTAKAPSSIRLSEKLGCLTEQQKAVLKEVFIDVIDGALNNFLWFIEESEKFDLISLKNQKVKSIREMSDGLSVDYWNFVNAYSKYKRVDL